MKINKLIKITAKNGLRHFEGISNDSGISIHFSESPIYKGVFCAIEYDFNKKTYTVQAEAFGPLTRLFVDYKHMCKVLKENVKVN